MTNEINHVINVLSPAANVFAGAVPTKVINMKNWANACFIVQCGVGAVGTALITIEACSDVTPTLTTSIPFVYQECVTGDTYGPIIQAPATGFTTAAASHKVYKVFVLNQSLATTGYSYVRLKSTEVVVGAIAGGVVAVLSKGRFEHEVPDTVLV